MVARPRSSTLATPTHARGQIHHYDDDDGDDGDDGDGGDDGDDGDGGDGGDGCDGDGGGDDMCQGLGEVLNV